MKKVWKNILKFGLAAIGIGAGVYVGKKYRQVATAGEPIAFHIPVNSTESVKQGLIAQGFQELNPWALEEVKCDNELWGVAKFLDDLSQLHVRAIALPQEIGTVGLSAHVEPRRDHIIDHLSGKGDYKMGAVLLRQFI